MRNKIARDLHSPKYRQRVIRSKKAYSRRWKMDIDDNANTVRGRYGMACPKCGRDDRLSVVIPCVVRLTPQGGENEQYASDYDINSETECFCGHCDWVGEAGDAHLDGPQTMDR